MILRAGSICCLLLALTGTMAAQDKGSMPAPTQAPANIAAPETSPDADGIYRIGHDGVSAPVVLYKPEPRYTDEARHKKVSGVVTLALTVDANGSPQNVRVVHSISERVKPKQHDAALTLDERALEAVKLYRFKPAMRAGIPVPVKVYVEVQFVLFHFF